MLKDVNEYLVKLASVLRDKKKILFQNNNKKVQIFGSLSTNISQNFNLNYKFAIDNNLDDIEYNDIGTTFSVNNFVAF